jgi:tight adherence protein C
MIAMTIFKDEGSFSVQEKFEDVDNNNKQINFANYGIVFRYSRVFFRRYFTPIVQGMKNKATIKEKYRRSIANGGMLIISSEDFFAFKLFLILGFPALFLAFRFMMDMDWSLALTPVVSLIGYLYPDIWMKGRIERRKKEIINAMPFVVDMLALSIEAGLDFIAAMARVIEKAPKTALTDEFEILIKEIKIGSSRADALRQLSWRVDEIVVNSFCATLIAADSVGASVGPILKTLSNEIRQKRSSLIEQAGAKAATKILFPMIIFILPAVFIITFVPLALDIGGN